MSTLSATPDTPGDIASVLARAAALDERNRLLEEENRWLKAQLFGRSSEKMPADIPRIEVVHDLSAAEKICPSDGTALERIGEESFEQLEFIPAQIRVLKHIRPKYACPCCHAGVRIAPLPVTLFPKSILTPSLAAHITTAKFVDGTPLYRQEPQFERMGIPLGRGTMALWMMRIGTILVVPLINLLNELLLA